jgi:lipoprotein-anchoring transpeptidase ErfK/SrfK
MRAWFNSATSYILTPQRSRLSKYPKGFFSVVAGRTRLVAIRYAIEATSIAYQGTNMKRTTLTLLSALAVVTCVAWSPTVAHAQGGWSGSGAPVFQSDLDRVAKQREAERAEFRKSSAPTAYPAYMSGGDKPNVAPEAPPIVYLQQNESPGTVIVDTQGKRLLYVLPDKRAYQYPISVGRDGFTWTGTERVSRIASWPTWTPPSEMRQRQKGLPVTVTGGLINPLGAVALYLGNSIYRIHGTNNDRTIGRASSSGCFRLTNRHVVHLATLARVGTTVRVVSSYSGVSESAPMSSLFGSSSAAAEVAPAKKTKKN